MKTLFHYLFHYKALSIGRVITNVCKAFCAVVLSVMLGSVLDGLTAMNKNVLMSSVIRCILIIIFYICISGIDVYVTTLHTKKVLNYMKQDIFSKIMNGSIEKYKKMHTGNYVSILSNDISIVHDEFIENFFELIFQVLSFGISLVVLIRINVAVTCIILAISLISMFVVSKISNKLMERQVKFSESLQNVTKLVSDIFSGIFVIKNYNIVNKMEDIYYSNDEIVEENRKKFSMAVGLINILMVIFSMLTYITIILYCAYSVINASLSAGTALIIIQLSSNLTEPINEIISIASSMFSVKGIGSKIEKLKRNCEDDTENVIKKDDYNQGIAIQQLCFRYTDEGEDIIHNLELQIEKGKKYALVGESGSGKSTIIKLLLKYYHRYSGKILIDGTDIQSISMESYCGLVSCMEQDTFIFDETLKDNVCMFSNYTDEEIYDAIEKADLGGVVRRLPNGIDTILGEGGCNLSGGECQRIAFARLLLKKTPILLLDEATANLDNKTTGKLERLILDNKDLTLISVTHKLMKQILEEYDEIIVLKKGNIIEKGSFQQLIEKEGYFYNLYNLQTASV